MNKELSSLKILKINNIQDEQVNKITNGRSKGKKHIVPYNYFLLFL